MHDHTISPVAPKPYEHASLLSLSVRENMWKIAEGGTDKHAHTYADIELDWPVSQ